MKLIKLLPKEVIAQIAAGEVIQRPENVIKELVENSIDAQASQISINMTDTGLTKIEIIDDGIGIEKDQLKLAVTPHATSKFKVTSDFQSLMTHGFRGEALASISLVSRLELASRTNKSQSGYQITVDHGRINQVVPKGMPKGSQITITKLFDNSPVRQEFLSKSKTELRRIVDVITQLALTHFQIGFDLTHNNRLLLSVPASQSILERTETLLGTGTFSQLIPIDYSSVDPSSNIKILGFISQPSFWTKRPEKQFLSFNKRPVSHKSLQNFLKNLAQTYQSNKYHPVYVLHTQIEPKHIDVNIHPQKQTVDLFNYPDIKSAFKNAIEHKLKSRPITYSSASEFNYQVSDIEGEYKTNSFRRGLYQEYSKSTQQVPHLTGTIDQIARLYLVAPTTDGLLLIDQHALHERILFDQLTDLYINNQKLKTNNPIAINLAFDLDIAQAALLEENIDTFTKLGIEIEPFGTHSFKINSVPKLYADHDLKSFIIEVLDQIENDDELKLDTQSEKILASMACRLAIMAGDYVEPEIRINLFNQLISGKHAGTCPHGRPVSIKITLQELNKLFRRS